MPQVRAYETGLKGDFEGKYTEVVYALSAGKAKYRRLLSIWDAWGEDATWNGKPASFAILTCRRVGEFQSLSLHRTAVYRGLEFARVGMAIEVGGARGVIVGSNDSANFDVLFTGGKFAGLGDDRGAALMQGLTKHAWWYLMILYPTLAADNLQGMISTPIAACGQSTLAPKPRNGRPLVLVGETKSARNVRMLSEHGWGRMFVTKPPTPYPFEPWGFDNGAFGAWINGMPFPVAAFRRRLEKAREVSSDPYLAVVPDQVGNGCESLDFSMQWRTGELRDVDFPWYLAVQDGMEIRDVEPRLHLFSGIFLGGTDRFKAQAYRWCRLAHKYQKRFHYGRASTPGKLSSAFKVGADSCDSSFPLWTNDRMRIFIARWEGLGFQQTINFPLAVQEPGPSDQRAPDVLVQPKRL